MSERRLTDAEFLDALDEMIVEDIMSMTGAELRAELIADGGDPDAMIREASAALERAIQTSKDARLGETVTGLGGSYGREGSPRIFEELVDPSHDRVVRVPRHGLQAGEDADAGGVVLRLVGHTRESEAVCAAGQLRTDAEARS